MKHRFKKKPRVFGVKGHVIKDWGKIMLEHGEMVTFVTKSGRECDFSAKDWGFYLGPSLNSRLKKEGFKVALSINENGQLYVHAVEKNKMRSFKKFAVTNQKITVLCWLDEWLTSSR